MGILGATGHYGRGSSSKNKRLRLGYGALSSEPITPVEDGMIQNESENSIIEQPPPSALVEQCPGQSLVERLPPELYALVLRHMDPVHGVLLSLTCKELWSRLTTKTSDVLYKARRCTELPETLEFLKQLEKDKRDVILCTACLSLHPRLKDEAKKLMSFDIVNKGRLCSDSLGSMSFGEFPDHEVVPREVVELILRASELGPDFGLPIDTLETSHNWIKYNPGKVPVSLISKAVIAKSSQGVHCLLLRIVHEVEIDFRRDISQQIQASRVRGCSHGYVEEQNLMTRTFQAIKTADLEDYIEESDEHITIPDSQGSYRCPKCPCDFEVRTAKKKNEVFGVAHVYAWRDLGPRGDHNSLLWQNTVNGYFRDDFDRADPVTGSQFGNDSLKEVWTKAVKERVD